MDYPPLQHSMCFSVAGRSVRRNFDERGPLISQIRRSAASQEKKPWLREKFTNFAAIFPEYYV
jgi:hypothetical protein